MGRYPSGGKIARSHSTVIEAAEVIIHAIEKDANSKRVSLSIIDNRSRCRNHRLRFKPANGGIKVIVYGIGQHQELYVYTSDVESTKAKLKAAFEERYPHALKE